MKFKYFQRIEISTDGNGVGVWPFRANSLFDPDQILGGNQPTGFDQWTQFYDWYLVFGCKISAMLVNVGSTGNDLIEAYLIPTRDNVFANGQMSTSDPATWPNVRWKLLQPNAGSRWQRGVLKNYMSTKKMFNVPRLDVGDPDQSSYSGTMGGSGTGTNPQNQWYWNLVIKNTTGNLETPIQAYIRLTYYSTIFGRVDLIKS